MQDQAQSSRELRQRFRRDGFLALEALTDAQTVAELATVYDQMLAGEVTCAATDRLLGDVTRQIMMPSRYHPLFRDNAALHAGRAIAAQVLDCAHPVRVYDMLTYKPPSHNVATPWHQDYAYAFMPAARAGARVAQNFVQFWVPLDDVDENTGCMQFIPGVHTHPLLPHVVASGDPDDEGRLLAIDAPHAHLDLARAVVCPLAAGGARYTDRRRRTIQVRIARRRGSGGHTFLTSRFRRTM